MRVESRGKRSPFRPCIELLEARAVPAVYRVTGTADGAGLFEGGAGTGADPFRWSTLRGALNDVNTNQAGEANTIRLTGGLTYDLTDGQLTADLAPGGSLTIKAVGGGGDRATIEAIQPDEGEPFRVIEFSEDTIAELKKIVVTGGVDLLGEEFDFDGGGGILNYGTLSLSNSVVTANEAIGVFDGSSKFDLLAAGGGIANYGTLTLDKSAVTFNSVATGFDEEEIPLLFGFGGGIFNAGDLTLNNRSVVADNRVESKFAFGGGIATGPASEVGASLSLNHSTVADNTVQGVAIGFSKFEGISSFASGGGISDFGSSTIDITDSTVRDNIAHGGDVAEIGDFTTAGFASGGGLGSGFLFIGEAGSSDVKITRSTFSGNRAIGGSSTAEGVAAGSAFGGGMSLSDYLSFLAVNSTFSGNWALGGTAPESVGEGVGGGVFLERETLTRGGLVPGRFVNVTITQNLALSGGEGNGGGVANEGDPVAVWNTIIAQNFVNEGNESVAGSDVVGDFISTGVESGYNLIGNIDGSTGFGGPGSHDITGGAANVINARLGPLASNGGPTQTHALRSGSPALNAGDNDVLGAPFFLRTDQRGKPRKSGPRVDIGAFEVEADDVLGRRWNR